MPFSGVSINRNWAARHMKTAQNFLGAHDKAVAWFIDPANRRRRSTS